MEEATMVRAARVVLGVLGFVGIFTSCGDSQPAPAPAVAGEACPAPNAKAIGVTGCDLCTCVQGQWSCSGGDCACSGDVSLFLGDGCTLCPCTGGKYKCTYKSCNGCPPSRTDLSCTPRKVWARDEESGLCCEYDRPCAVSFGWTTYFSEAACNPLGCSCDRTTGAPPQPIGCACPLSGCPTLADMLSTPCTGDGIPIVERHGCGKVELELDGGFSGWISVFDEASGRLIGRTVGSDQQGGVCLVFGYTFGEDFACTDIVSECSHCGVSTLPDAAPACPE
jgi:hypothetical protein